MPDIPIKLVRAGAKALKPQADNKHTSNDVTQVPAGSTVTFTTEDGVTGTTINFEDNSPFDKNVVGYNQPIPVRVTFNAGDKHNNIFKYRCRGKTANGDVLDGDAGGGEVEIIRP